MKHLEEVSSSDETLRSRRGAALVLLPPINRGRRTGAFEGRRKTKTQRGGGTFSEEEGTSVTKMTSDETRRHRRQREKTSGRRVCPQTRQERRRQIRRRRYCGERRDSLLKKWKRLALCALDALSAGLVVVVVVVLLSGGTLALAEFVEVDLLERDFFDFFGVVRVVV